MGLSKSWLLRIISLGVTAVVGVGLGIGNSVLNQNENNINQILCPPIANYKQLDITRESGQAMSKQIVEEGAVLLKNNRNTLPLSAGVTAVNVFGWASVDWAYGANSGSCSGRVMPEDNNASSLHDLYDALESYGIEYNKDLQSMYKRYFAPYVYAAVAPNNVNNGNVVTLHEPDINDKSYYSEDLLANALLYSDTALVVITRNAGEDIPADRAMNKGGAGAVRENDKIYLDLSIEEEKLLTYVGENYDDVVVIINCPVAMDLEFLDVIPGLDAALQVGFTGTQGADVIPELLWGDKTPSGHLVDTYAYDRNTSFAMKSKNGARFSSGGNGKQFFEYIENIYVGYKWYETADATNYWQSYTKKILDNRDREIEVQGFDAVVQYPFGYGLSYTDFEWEVLEYNLTDARGNPTNVLDPMGDLNIKVMVRNTGIYDGKYVVEVYLTAPYHNGEIEKSHVSLVGFEKTDLIEAGDSEVIDIKVSIYDCLSYDCYDKNGNDHKGYELDRGNYQFKLMTDSHNIKTVNFAGGRQNVDGIIEINNPSTIDVDEDKYTGNEVRNLFTGSEAVDGYPIDAVADGYAPNYLSRANFPDIKQFNGLSPRASTTSLENAYRFTQAKGDAWDNATTDNFGNPVHSEAVTWGDRTNNYRVYSTGTGVTEDGYTLGADYDDPLWDDVLNQITTSEVTGVINQSYGTAAISSVGKPTCPELDGPAQIKCYYQSAPRGTGYPSAVVIAQTWNKTLCESFGLSYAADMVAVSINGLWGWGCNIHRTPVGGRNWEYFSEDPFISGTVLANAVKGLNNGGRYCYIKHFCLNESETNKVEGFTFTTEQALRETYLKPFQMGVQQGGALGIMTSFNRIGAVYSGGSEAAITGVARNEWGFKGSIITDWANNNGYMCIDHQFRAGGDLGMNCSLNSSGPRFDYSASATPRVQYQMREVAHHVLYTFLRSQYLNKEYNENPEATTKVVQSEVIQSWKWWKTAVVDLNVVLIGGALLFVALTFLPDKKKAPKDAE